MKLTGLKETGIPLQKLSQDIDSFTDMSCEIKYNQMEAKELENLLHRYINTLISNLDKRFSESSAILAELSIFDPTTVPKSIEPGFKSYGVNHVTCLQTTSSQMLQIKTNFKLSGQALSSPSMTFYSQACQKI